MKLYKYHNFYTKFIVFFLLCLLLNNDNIFGQDSSIEEYFNNYPSSYYYVGIRHFYLGSLFSEVLIDGNFEDNYTELLFIIPIGGTIGLCIQGDQKVILDSFLFIFDEFAGEYRQNNDAIFMSLFSHRYNVLVEIIRIRFRILTREQIDFLLMPYN